MMDFSAEQPSPSQTPTSTASDGAHRAPLEINNTPIADRSMLSERELKVINSKDLILDITDIPSRRFK